MKLLPIEKKLQNGIDNRLSEHLDPESWLRRAIVKVFPWTLRIFLTAVTSFIILTFLNFGKEKKPIIYGVSFDPWYSMSLGLDWRLTYLEILDDLGVTHLRLAAFWNQIEPQRDQYYWNDFDWMLQEAQKRDVKVIMSIGRKLPRWPECHDPEWIKELKSEAVQREQLQMLKDAVEHFKQYNAIEVWQVENEPFFPFGICELADPKFVKTEIALVRSLDSRPIITSDSGEGGVWKVSADMADYLAISMYRKVYLEWLGYIRYPLPSWNYRFKAAFLNIPRDKIWCTELQAEPWTPGPLHLQSQEEKDKTMSPNRFRKAIKYAQKAGFDRIYMWGVEWWAFEKEQGNDFYWEYAKQYLSW